MEDPIKLDDLGVPLFQETSTYIYIHMYNNNNNNNNNNINNKINILRIYTYYISSIHLFVYIYIYIYSLFFTVEIPRWAAEADPQLLWLQRHRAHRCAERIGGTADSAAAGWTFDPSKHGITPHDVPVMLNYRRICICIITWFIWYYRYYM